jgi:STE24 endopeptidase
MFYVFSLFLGNDLLLTAFGFEHYSIYASLFCVAFLYSPISAVRSLLTNIISRRFEFEADQYAVVSTRDAHSLISALKKLSLENLSNLNPHPLKVFLEYSHPPVVQRIRAMAKFAE